MIKKKLFVFSLLILSLLSFFVINRYLGTRALATWQFYGFQGSVLTGHYYPPAKDSATGYPISVPEIPEAEGLKITQWNNCFLELNMGDKTLSISYFTDGLIQASIKKRIYPYTSLSELYFYQPDDMHWWVNRLSDGTYKGWSWDNLENQLIAVHYKEDRISLIDGTNYQLMEGGNWFFQRWLDGNIIEERELIDLPKKDNFIPEQDKEKLAIAKLQFQEWTNELVLPLNLPFTLQIWDNTFCDQ